MGVLGGSDSGAIFSPTTNWGPWTGALLRLGFAGMLQAALLLASAASVSTAATPGGIDPLPNDDCPSTGRDRKNSTVPSPAWIRSLTCSGV